MEPNLKEGIGGLRDANLVYWIGKLLYNISYIRELPSEIIEESDYREFHTALEFLFRVRSALHLVTEKEEDRLRLEYIPEIATLLGYDTASHAQMKFTKKTIQSLRIVNLFGKIWLEALISIYLPDTYDDYLLLKEEGTLAKLIKPEISKSEIEIDCEHSREYGALRLRTRDQRGLLAFVSHLFDQLEIDIVSTKIHTSKYRVNDLFLIQKDGNFCHNTEIIIKALTE